MTSGEMESSSPTGGKEVFERVEFGYRYFRCVPEGQTVGYRVRDDHGRLVQEFALKDGLLHGLERHWAPDGMLEFETCYVEGLEHGTAKQWLDGRLLGTYRMDGGTGVDLWRHADGTLAEERHCMGGDRHGFERWWNGDDRTVWLEGHYQRGKPHGILREWNRRARLRRGYPQYFVDGDRVTKRQYLKAAAADPSLPLFREADNLPERPLPREYVDERQACG
jgi:hypothetical protein